VVRDPYARWCGRRESVSFLPIPIRVNMKKRLIITILFICFSAYCQETFKIIEDENKVKNIFLGNVRVTDFKNPHHIYSFSQSIDKKLLLVYHMDFKPTRVSIFNLKTKRKVNSFKPGVNGSFTFGAKNRIILTFGFGTGRYLRILDLDGIDVYDGRKSLLYEKSDIVINKTKSLIYRYPNVKGGKIFEVINVETGTTKVFGLEDKGKLKEENINWKKP